MPKPPKQKCKACNGTGKSSNGRDCVPCGSTGFRVRKNDLKSLNPKAKIDRLKARINFHNHLYYRGKTEITDLEFDKLFQELVRMEKKHPQFVTTDSPTQCVDDGTGFKTRRKRQNGKHNRK